MERWVCPAREAWGLEAYQRLSPELEARLTYTATEVGSYERAARMADTWGSPASDGCIHEHAQRLGAAAAELELPTPAPPPREPEFSLVIMLDGWMARERGPDWGAGPRKKKPQRIAWHEIKSAVIYRLEQRAQERQRPRPAGGEVCGGHAAGNVAGGLWGRGARPRRGGGDWDGRRWSIW